MKKTILLIEDEKILSDMYKDKLELSGGFNVVSAFNVEEALKATLESSPDLILLDILLPGENGISFLEKMRSDDRISSIPVIAFSNFDDPQTKIAAQRFDIKEYLIKTDYTPQDIVDKINYFLKN